MQYDKSLQDVLNVKAYIADFFNIKNFYCLVFNNL